MVLNHIGTSLISLQSDNIELKRNIHHLSTLGDMERQVSEAEIQVLEVERREIQRSEDNYHH